MNTIKTILFITLFLSVHNSYSQYDEERFPIPVEDIAFNKTHKIASLTTTEKVGNETNIHISKYDKNGLLVYKLKPGVQWIKSYTYKYDTKLRLIEIIDSTIDEKYDSASVSVSSFSYYDNGLLKEHINDEEKIVFVYDKNLNKLTESNPEDEDYTIVDYYYNPALQLIKEIGKEEDLEESDFFEYDAEGRLVKQLKVITEPNWYDSVTGTLVYNTKGLIEKETFYKVRGYKEDDEVGDGKMLTQITQKQWEFEYDNKGRRIKMLEYADNKSRIESQIKHTFTLNKGIETETIITTTDNRIVFEETIVYNGPKKLKGQSTLNDTRTGSSRITVTKYTYTFY